MGLLGYGLDAGDGNQTADLLARNLPPISLGDLSVVGRLKSAPARPRSALPPQRARRVHPHSRPNKQASLDLTSVETHAPHARARPITAAESLQAVTWGGQGAAGRVPSPARCNSPPIVSGRHPHRLFFSSVLITRRPRRSTPWAFSLPVSGSSRSDTTPGTLALPSRTVPPPPRPSSSTPHPAPHRTPMPGIPRLRPPRSLFAWPIPVSVSVTVPVPRPRPETEPRPPRPCATRPVARVSHHLPWNEEALVRILARR